MTAWGVALVFYAGLGVGLLVARLAWGPPFSWVERRREWREMRERAAERAEFRAWLDGLEED